MRFDPPLQQAVLLRRYKRFLADIELPDGSVTTIHCANTGAMTGCADAGNRVWYSTSDNPKRKYPCSWELSQTPDKAMICVNTIRANQLAAEAIQSGVITELSGYTTLKTEVKYGQENSRIDILLSAPGRPDCFVEVKSVTLAGENGQGYFPDAVTTRGQKHLRELTDMVNSGSRAILLFVVLHTGIEKVSAAYHIDALYSKLLTQAKESGVEILCYKANISGSNIHLVSSVAFLDSNFEKQQQ